MKMSVRLAKPEDAENYSEWLKASVPVSHADPHAALGTQAFTAVVDQDGKPVLMQTAQPVLMLEAIAPKPGISPVQSARAIREMWLAFQRVAKAYGVSEIWFGSDYKPTQDMIAKHPKYGITPVSLQMYRMKVVPDETH